MEDAKDVVKVAIENIYLVLKYMASGFIAVAVYFFLDEDLNLADLKDNTTLIFFLAIAIGLLTYAFHFACLDKLFYGRAASKCWHKFNNDEKNEVMIDIGNSTKRKSEAADNKWDRFKNKFEKTPDLFLLATQTYLRQVSSNPKIIKIQELMERRLAFLNFLYCSGYQMMLLFAYFLLKNIFNKIPHRKYGEVYIDCKEWLSLNMLLVLIGGMVLLCLAFIFNKRICKREQWVIRHFSQNANNAKKQKPEETNWNITLNILEK